MSRLSEVFSHKHVVLPVIHVASTDQALRNTRIARDACADGVFLINQGTLAEELLSIHQEVVIAFPEWWVGVNCMGVETSDVFGLLGDGVSGVWVDNALIDEGMEEQPSAERVLASRRKHGFQGLYFGGTAFKYQREVEDLASAARIASRYMDVVTTSGPGTGEAAAVQKIRIMKQALGEFPLAIASGITPENVGDYLDIADCFLVATGISRSFEELDPDRVRALVNRVREAE